MKLKEGWRIFDRAYAHSDATGMKLFGCVRLFYRQLIATECETVAKMSVSRYSIQIVKKISG